MKLCFLLLTVVTTACIFIACSNDEPLEHLPGTWTLSSVEVDGQTGTGLGTITFNEDLTGNIAITFMGAGIQITRGGSFTYQATSDEIIFSGISQPDLTWDRHKNNSDEQTFSFTEQVSGDIYNVTLEFTR